jgi:DNA topoisomerase IA
VITNSRRHIINAARHPIQLDDLQASAVDARRELDLRTGAAFTRILTDALKPMIKGVDENIKVISYGEFRIPTGEAILKVVRVLSISDAWLCCRSIFSSQKLCS